MLHVDLDTGQIETEERGPEYWERYIGGRGGGAKLLSEEGFPLDSYPPRRPGFFSTAPSARTHGSRNPPWGGPESSLTRYYSCLAGRGRRADQSVPQEDARAEQGAQRLLPRTRHDGDPSEGERREPLADTQLARCEMGSGREPLLPEVLEHPHRLHDLLRLLDSLHADERIPLR